MSESPSHELPSDPPLEAAPPTTALTLATHAATAVIADNSPAPGPPMRYAGRHGVVSLRLHACGTEAITPGWSALAVESVAFAGYGPGHDPVGPHEPGYLPATLEFDTAPVRQGDSPYLSGPTAILRIPPGPRFGVAITARYTLGDTPTGVAVITSTVTYRFTRPQTWGRAFTAHWVNRVYAPVDRGLYVPGHTPNNPRPRWLRVWAADHNAPREIHEAHTPLPQVPAGGTQPASSGRAGPGTAQAAARAAGAPFTWGAPLWYGKLRPNLAMVAVFGQPEVTGLAYSPTGGLIEPSDTCGWGFFHRLGAVTANREYTISQSLLLIPWVDDTSGRAAVISHFEALSGSSLGVDLDGNTP